MTFPMLMFTTNSGVTDVAITMTDTATATRSTGVATFTNRTIGAASSDRWVYVVATAESNDENTSCTIAGSSADVVAGPISDTSPSPDTTITIFRRLVTSGTTATITVTGGTGSSDVGITVFRVTGGTGTVGTGQTAINGGSVGFTIAAGGGIIVGNANNGGATTWTNLTEDSDFSVGGDGHSAGHRTSAGGESVTVSYTGPIASNACTAGVDIS